MAEVSQHAREVEARDPFPGVLVLARAGGFWGSKRKDTASELGQSRRTDHDLTHALVVSHLEIRESRPHHPSRLANAVLQGDAAL